MQRGMQQCFKILIDLRKYITPLPNQTSKQESYAEVRKTF